MKKDRKCKHCNKTFEDIEGRIFSNHVRGCDKNQKNPRNKEYIEKLSKKSYLREEKIKGKLKWFEVSCNKCEAIFSVKEREKVHPKKDKYFCCRSCANSKCSSGPKTLKSRNKVSKNSKILGSSPSYVEKHLKNNKKFFTSKGEEDLRSFIKNTDKNGEGTFGGSLSLGGERLCRDLYSNKLKICIEYDGIGHFKDIHGQLYTKQKKDNLLEEGCLKNEYRLIRIDEEYYKKNPTHGKQKILDEIYNGSEQIVKFGDKY